MKILAVSDTEEKILWDYFDKELVKDVELIISCGDLHASYLEFLVTMMNCPLLYVRGNHDRNYEQKPPQGCICLEDNVVDYKGLRILGLGGSMRYHEGPNMFTEKEMRSRVRKIRRRLSMTNGFDLLITHSPAKGYGDMEDLPHQGFEVFNDLMEEYKPAYMFHGHVHSEYGRNIQTEYYHTAGTHIINVNGYRILDIGEENYPKRGKTGSFLYDLYMSMSRQGAQDLYMRKGRGKEDDMPFY